MIDIVTKNIQQIGTVTEEDRIYIADKVYKTILEEQQREKNTYVLMGHTESSGTRYATFIEAAIRIWEVEYENGVPCWNNKVWSQVFKEIKNKYENMIIVGWALERKGYPVTVGPEIERLHREQFGGAHQLFFLVDSMEKDAFFYVNRNNHLRQKKGFFVYYRLEERFDEPDRIRIEIPDELEPKKENRQCGYRQYMAAQKKENPRQENSGMVVAVVAMLVVAIGLAAYTGRDVLRRKESKTVEVLSTEHEAAQKKDNNRENENTQENENAQENENVQGTESNLVPVEKVPGGSLVN